MYRWCIKVETCWRDGSLLKDVQADNEPTVICCTAVVSGKPMSYLHARDRGGGLTSSRDQVTLPQCTSFEFTTGI